MSKHWFNKYLPVVGCSKCTKGLINITEKDSWGKVKDCTCLQEYEKQKKVLSVLENCQNITEHLWKEATEEKCKKIISNFPEIQEVCRRIFVGLSGSLYLYGKPNVGKTLASAYIAKVFIQNGKEVQFDTIGGMLSIFRNFNDTASDYFQKCRTVPVLIIDDFGTEKVTDWTDSTIYNLINDRYLFGGFTIITGNCLPIDNFGEEKENISVADRISSKILRKYVTLKII